ncbi:hypothetical protein [Paenibacillus tarimensis]|uniref:hypothetical protein n=1 Tax=Paenibacillus tarimensis TaxID=416012 RepID=UPI001F32FEB2|nr:hypothetical protein [Paenibacillus tarimensis]MCF2943389.1 hypothetical protein [Paenibacillus tarimensis]
MAVLLISISISYFLLRVTEEQIVINKMVKFYKSAPNSERVINDKNAVKQFTYAVRFANKQPGIVDIADPQYQFVLGERQYYLWVSDRYSKGTLMKLPDTGTIYTIDESRTSGLLDIIKKAYDNGQE